MSRRKWRKKTLYIASYLEDSEDDYLNKILVYDEPQYIGLENIQPLSDTNGTYGLEIAGFGTKVIKMQKVLLDYNKYLGKFKENDLAYLDGVTPDGETINGENANYTVVAVRNQNKKIAIYFEKLPNK